MTLIERLEVVAKRMEADVAVTPNERANAALDEAGIDTNAPGAAVMHRHLILSLIRIAELEAALDEITTSAYPIDGAMCVPVGAWQNAMRLAKLKS